MAATTVRSTIPAFVPQSWTCGFIPKARARSYASRCSASDSDTSSIPETQDRSLRRDCPITRVIDEELPDSHGDQGREGGVVASAHRVIDETRWRRAHPEAARLQRHRHVIGLAQRSHEDG